MRLPVFFILTLSVLMIAACQGPPPIVYEIEVTAEVTRIVVVTATPQGTFGPIQSGATAEATEETEPGVTPSPTTQPFPTPVVNRIYVAEQRYENGRMFWLEPINQIWVLYSDAEEERNIWAVYTDTFQEGQPETDPTIVPPEGLFQPERGFGKLWRENPEVQEALGWALEPELGHVTDYEYRAGGRVENNSYISGPGYHLITSLYGDVFRFNEEDWTWEVAASSP